MFEVLTEKVAILPPALGPFCLLLLLLRLAIPGVGLDVPVEPLGLGKLLAFVLAAVPQTSEGLGKLRDDVALLLVHGARIDARLLPKKKSLQ